MGPGTLEADVGVPAAGGLAPQDWIHYLYLQPPANAEVLVQACGRSFVTSWDPVKQHWLTQELPEGYGRLPDQLPRIAHVSTPCLALDGSTPRQSSETGSSAPSPGRVPTSSHKLVLLGTSLQHAQASFAGRFHGNYLHVESRPMSAQQLQMYLAATEGSAEDLPSSIPWDAVELTVYGMTQPGLLQLECWFGNLLTCRKQVAIVSSSSVQQELAQYFSASQAIITAGLHAAAGLAGASGSQNGDSDAQGGLAVSVERKVDDLMTDLGCWAEYVGAARQLAVFLGLAPKELQVADAGTTADLLEQQAAGREAAGRPGPGEQEPDWSDPLMQACLAPEYRAQMVDTAVQLLAHSCSCGWTHTAGTLLSQVLTFGLDFEEVKRKVQAGGCSSLLHRAVCSNSPSMVRVVWDWGTTYGSPWTWAEADPGNGITPLHMAAALDASTGTPNNRGLLLTSASMGKVSSASSTLADWILQEFQAAYTYWHGAEDCRGLTPADVAELTSTSRSSGDAGTHPMALMNSLAAEEQGGTPVHQVHSGSLGQPAPGSEPLAFGSNLDSVGDNYLEELLSRIGGGAGPRPPRKPDQRRGSWADTQQPHGSWVAPAPRRGSWADYPRQQAVVQGALLQHPDMLYSTVGHHHPSVGDWVELQKQLAVQQGPLLPGPGGLAEAAATELPSHLLPTRLAPRAEFAPEPPSGADWDVSGMTAAVFAPGGVVPGPVDSPAKPAAPGASPAGDYKSLMSAIQQGMYKSDSANSAALMGAADLARRRSVTASYNGPTSARQRAHPAVPGNVPAGAFQSAAAGKGQVGKHSELQGLDQLMQPSELLRASISRFTSRRIEAGYVRWMEGRRIWLHRLLPPFMLFLLSAVCAQQAVQPRPPPGFATLAMYTLPWVGMVAAPHSPQAKARAHKAGDVKRAHAVVYNEHLWVLVMLWHLLVRSLQAAGWLHTPGSLSTFLSAGGDMLTEGFTQVFFQVRTRYAAILRLLYGLSTAALYIRIKPDAQVRALLVASFWNVVCLLVAWVLELVNRHAYVCFLVSRLRAATLRHRDKHSAANGSKLHRSLNSAGHNGKPSLPQVQGEAQLMQRPDMWRAGVKGASQQVRSRHSSRHAQYQKAQDAQQLAKLQHPQLKSRLAKSVGPMGMAQEQDVAYSKHK